MRFDAMAKSVKTNIFKSNQSQAVRLSKAVAFPADVIAVDIVAVGNQRIITPVGTAWDDWFTEPKVSDDFMEERFQPDNQSRESL